MQALISLARSIPRNSCSNLAARCVKCVIVVTTIGADEGPYPVSVDVSGGSVLELVVDEVDTDAWDNADWADARFECGS